MLQKICTQFDGYQYINGIYRTLIAVKWFKDSTGYNKSIRKDLVCGTTSLIRIRLSIQPTDRNKLITHKEKYIQLSLHWQEQVEYKELG